MAKHSSSAKRRTQAEILKELQDKIANHKAKKETREKIAQARKDLAALRGKR